MSFTLDIPNLRLGEFDLGGVLYHANYFHLYETAREAMIAEEGLHYSSFVAKGQHLAVINSSQIFHAPIFYGQALTISLSIPELRKASLTFAYEIFSNNKLLHSATTSHAFVQKISDSFKPTAIPKNLSAIFKKHLE